MSTLESMAISVSLVTTLILVRLQYFANRILPESVMWLVAKGRYEGGGRHTAPHGEVERRQTLKQGPQARQTWHRTYATGACVFVSVCVCVCVCVKESVRELQGKNCDYRHFQFSLFNFDLVVAPHSSTLTHQ